MMTDRQAERRAEIEAAAFDVLAKVGFKKASMLQIAKEAGASNQTLYAWYGNKQTLFSSLIRSHSRTLRETLASAIAGEIEPAGSLADVGRLLLQFTATTRAIIVNRAAVADAQDTGLLARSIDENARQIMVRLLEDLMRRLGDTGDYAFDEGEEVAAQVFICLILGELQIQQAFGTEPPLRPAEIERRSEWACRLFDRLYRAKP